MKIESRSDGQLNGQIDARTNAGREGSLKGWRQTEEGMDGGKDGQTDSGRNGGTERLI